MFTVRLHDPPPESRSREHIDRSAAPSRFRRLSRSRSVAVLLADVVGFKSCFFGQEIAEQQTDRDPLLVRRARGYSCRFAAGAGSSGVLAAASALIWRLFLVFFCRPRCSWTYIQSRPSRLLGIPWAFPIRPPFRYIISWFSALFVHAFF